MDMNADTIEINGKKYVLADSIPQTVPVERKGAWVTGTNYLIRTVTMMLTGRLEYIDDKELVLGDAAWIAESGRFNEAVKNGTLNEVEPFYGEAIVGRGAIVDATIWKHELPKKVK